MHCGEGWWRERLVPKPRLGFPTAIKPERPEAHSAVQLQPRRVLTAK